MGAKAIKDRPKARLSSSRKWLASFSRQGCGVDTAYYRDEWKGVSPLCEIVCVEFDPENNDYPVVGDPTKRIPLVHAVNDNTPPAQAGGQADLFGGVQ